ncbi:PREDICTED: DNA damage-regulated autophagy modulator protein 2-like [Priapulus caudatus]|uniref:DNA damage-regulated autophagy modulator protein 2-like n=1 Tax=Priapulus caudatus TaxID=37621 RepID=A0ABM1EW21_PRICU|nr:PREDICTED: DNA damage-regulated autophagy modulator protein 2-like [Priapulus caudatus]
MMGYLYLLPLSVSILVPFTFIISYVIAIARGDVEPAFPYISDTGTEPPESCIFGQLLNISAVLIGLSVYVRYRQTIEYHREGPRALLRLNKISLVLGVVAALGVSLVANFQLVFLKNKANIAGMLSMKKFTGDDMTKWYPEDGGWPEHLVSTACEWVMAISFILYFATYILEFRKIEMTEIQVYIVEEMQPLPIKEPDHQDSYGSIA